MSSFAEAWLGASSGENPVARVEVVTPPSSEPLTLTQVKKQLEIASSDDAHDDQLTLMIQEARELWEHDTDSAVLTQTLRVYANRFPGASMFLPRRPIQSITSVQYYDGGNNLQTLSTDIYAFDKPARALRLKVNQVWPITENRFDAVTITYVAGYSSVDNVPAIAKRAMLLMIGRWFEDREMGLTQPTSLYESLVARYMRPNYP